MTPDQFRNAILKNNLVDESSHQGHPDFRVGGKVIASLGYPKANCAMLKLTPDQQTAATKLNSSAFQPSKGAWGARGYTQVNLSETTLKELKVWIAMAVENQQIGK